MQANYIGRKIGQLFLQPIHRDGDDGLLNLYKITQIIVRRQPELEYGPLGHIRLGP